MVSMFVLLFFYFKQKTAYEVRISDWSSDVCSSDLIALDAVAQIDDRTACIDRLGDALDHLALGIGREELGHRVLVDLLDAQRDTLAGTVDRQHHGIQEIGRASCRERGCQDV